jgi:hypothetical protein
MREAVMANANDGGPAFPAPAVARTDMTGSDVTSGMSMRDWFAGQMLPRIGSGWPNDENKALLARRCYEIADAMIAEREKR